MQRVDEVALALALLEADEPRQQAVLGERAGGSGSRAQVGVREPHVVLEVDEVREALAAGRGAEDRDVAPGQVEAVPVPQARPPSDHEHLALERCLRYLRRVRHAHGHGPETLRELARRGPRLVREDDGDDLPGGEREHAAHALLDIREPVGGRPVASGR